jgi:glycosyltransferase involved in cell wall biosynthesis
VKIAQVVTYISADGAFGGPVSVAVSQAIELAARGHEVQLLAGWDGRAVIDAPGVDVRLFRARKFLSVGFSGLIAPGLLAHIRKNHKSYDAVHIHLARDLITLPAATYLAHRGVNYVVQPHGMVVPDGRIRARIFDTVAVRRVLRAATSVIAYRGVDDKALDEVSRGGASIDFLGNGVDVRSVGSFEPTNSEEVIFMARLHPRKRVMAFAEMARLLTARGVRCRFVVVGPDEGNLRELESFIVEHALERAFTYEGAVPYSDVRLRLSQSAAYVLPSVNEPFPVTVLEAMAVGVPCVITDSCGLAPMFLEDSAGLVTDGTPENMADAVERLFQDPAFRQSVIANADRAIRQRFSIAAVVELLLGFYRKGMVRT